MPEHEAPDFERCSVCGRTALRGERLWDYVTPARDVRRVCALCKSHAETANWLPRELAAERLNGPNSRHSRARALRERLARVAESARTRSGEATDAAHGEERPARRLRIRVERSERGEHEAPRVAPRRQEAVAHAGEERRPAVATAAIADDPRRAVYHAIDRFNASEARRTVAGLIRSLGEPQASIQLRDARKPATVTVAWEISWYQWAVEPGEHGEVREVSKGKEIEELSDEARQWNGRVAEDGSLRVQAA